MAFASTQRQSRGSNTSAHDNYVDEIVVEPQRRPISSDTRDDLYYFPNGNFELRERKESEAIRREEVNSSNTGGSLGRKPKGLFARKLWQQRPWVSQTNLDAVHDPYDTSDSQWIFEADSKTTLTHKRASDQEAGNSKPERKLKKALFMWRGPSSEEATETGTQVNTKRRQMKFRRQRHGLQQQEDADVIDARHTDDERLSYRLQPIANHGNGFNTRSISSVRVSPRQRTLESPEKLETVESANKQWNGVSSALSCIYAIFLIALYIAFGVIMSTSPAVPVYYYVGFPLLMVLMSIVVLLMFYISWIINSFKRKKDRPEVVPEIEGRSWSSLKENARNQQIWPVIGERPLRFILLWLGLCCSAGLILNFVQFVLSTCLPLVLGLFYILAAIVVLLQLPLLLKNNKMSELTPRILSKFGVMHLLVTNTCIGVHHIIFGIDYLVRVRAFITLNGNCLACESYDYLDVRNLVIRACEFKMLYSYEIYIGMLYLLPHVIAFCILSGILLIFVWQNLNSQFVYYNDEEDRSSLWKSSHTWRKVWSGVLSIVVILLTAAAIILFFAFTINKHSTINFYIFRGYEIFVHCVISCLILIVFLRIRQLGTDALKDLSLATVLLTFSLIGVFLYNLFYLIGHFHLSFLSPKYIISIINNVVAMFTSCLQYSFLIRLNRRHAVSPEQVQKAPGYFGLASLLVFNISLYVINVVENHVNEFSAMQSEIYGNAVWASIQVLTIPVMLLFRLGCIFVNGAVVMNMYTITPDRFSSPAIMTSF